MKTESGRMKCKNCGKLVDQVVTLEVEGRKTPAFCHKCFERRMDQVGKSLKGKDMGRKKTSETVEGAGTTVLEPEDLSGGAGATAEIIDSKTSEVLDPETCRERLREILLKRDEIALAQTLVDECKDQVDAAEESLDEARKELAARKGELNEIESGQRLLF